MVETETNELPCIEKLVFDSKDEAEAMATTLHWQRGEVLKAYRCKHCQLWHLSSN